MSYYQTYRPQSFADLLGQDSVKIILQEALKQGKVSHAYLFCGSRGTGKTTTARLLAKALNCLKATADTAVFEPCNTCLHCQAINEGSFIDVIEVDAASNRGIDEIKQLQEQGRFQPQRGKKKIFIIDEVHMLTKEAFNALLKTLEEPPSHLLFILATTELHKVPETIISRCQRFNFLTPSQPVIEQYLAQIIKQEKLTVEKEALTEIVRLAHGSFRDGATLLEQATQGQAKLTRQALVELFGLADRSLLERFLHRLTGKADEALSHDLNQHFERGGSPQAFLEASYQLLQDELVTGSFEGDPMVILATLTRLRYQLKYSPVASLPILAIVASVKLPVDEVQEISHPASSLTKTTLSGEGNAVIQVSHQSAGDKMAEQKTNQTNETVEVSVAEQVPPVDLPNNNLTEQWQESIRALTEAKQSSLVAMLKTATPLSWKAPVLRIGVQFTFHAEQLVKQKNRAILESTLTKFLGQTVHIETQMQPLRDLATEAETILADL